MLDDAGVDACTVAGWSIGVNTAFELAVVHPRRVRAIEYSSSPSLIE